MGVNRFGWQSGNIKKEASLLYVVERKHEMDMLRPTPVMHERESLLFSVPRVSFWGGVHGRDNLLVSHSELPLAIWEDISIRNVQHKIVEKFVYHGIAPFWEYSQLITFRHT